MSPPSNHEIWTHCWSNVDQCLASVVDVVVECLLGSQPGQRVIIPECHIIYVIRSQDWTTPELIALQDWKNQLLSWLPLSDIPHVSKINLILLFTTLLHTDFSNRCIVHYIHYIVQYILHVTRTRLRYVLKT